MGRLVVSVDALVDRTLSMTCWSTLQADAILRGRQGTGGKRTRGVFSWEQCPQESGVHKKQHTTSATGVGFGANMIIFYHVLGPRARQF